MIVEFVLFLLWGRVNSGGWGKKEGVGGEEVGNGRREGRGERGKDERSDMAEQLLAVTMIVVVVSPPARLNSATRAAHA